MAITSQQTQQTQQTQEAQIIVIYTHHLFRFMKILHFSKKVLVSAEPTT